MSDTVTAALISGAVGIVVGLLPLAYLVRKDHKEKEERLRADAERELEQGRERLATVAKTYLALLGKVMALLDVLRVDAPNADDLLKHVSEANAELQGFSQGDLLVTFGAQSPVVWADRACRRIVGKALDLAHAARVSNFTGESADETQRKIRELTSMRSTTEGRVISCDGRRKRRSSGGQNRSQALKRRATWLTTYRASLAWTGIPPQAPPDN